MAPNTIGGAGDSEGTYVFAISCRRLGLLKIGVADEPGKRNYLEGRVRLKLDSEFV